MKVTMQTTAASPDRVLQLGKTYDLPKEVAQSLVDAKAALPAKREAKPERVPVSPDPEDSPAFVNVDELDLNL